MKKFATLLSLMIVFTTNAQFGQIENGGFENWTNTPLFYTPLDWNSSNLDYGIETVSKSPDAQEGLSSVILKTIIKDLDTITGYVYHGSDDTGIDYTDNFETVSIQFKSNLTQDDTLYMILTRFDQFDNQLELQIRPVGYGINNNWTQSIVTVGNQSQSKIGIAFTIGKEPGLNFLPSPNSTVQIDNIQLYSGNTEQTPIPNYSFENWEEITYQNPENWYSYNQLLTVYDLENITKTTDANSGSFAVKMTTIDIEGDATPGLIANGPLNYSTFGFKPIPYNASPTTISGAYKYSPNGNDNGEMYIQFFKLGNVIGGHVETFMNQTNYTSFSSNIILVGTPDSMSIIASSGNNVGSVLMLDDLSFSGNNVGIEEFSNMEINIYPNPAKNKVMIKSNNVFNYKIIDLSGKIVMSGDNNKSAIEVDIDHLNSGAYFIKINNKENYKLIIE